MTLCEIKKAFAKGDVLQFRRLHHPVGKWQALSKDEPATWVDRDYEYRIRPPMWYLIRMLDGSQPEITCDGMDIKYFRKYPEKFIIEELYENDT